MMIAAKLTNILHYFMENSIPMHTEVKVGVYLKNEDGSMMIQEFEIQV